MPALDPEQACRQVLDAGLVVHRAHPLNCETPLAALTGGVLIPNARFYVRNHFQIPGLDPGGWRLEVIPVRSESELDAAFATMAQHKVDAVLPTVDAIFGDFGERIAALLMRYALPAVGGRGFNGVNGAVIEYGPNPSERPRLGGIYVGRILKGEKPGDLPVLQPTKFELVINLKTAKALGLTVPAGLLAAADEVIE